MAIVVGLTGSIATGKTVVARMFEEFGAKIIDADQVAREIVLPGTTALTEIIAAFGQGVLDASGELNRKTLAGKVFGDAANLQKLNQITHPRISERIKRLTEGYANAGAEVVVIDAPLLVETGLWQMADKVVVTTASESLQIERIRERDGLSQAEAHKRIASQLPQADKVQRADYVIRTDCPFAEVRAQAKEVWREIICAKDAGFDRT